MKYIVPSLILILVIFGCIKRVNIYNCFVDGSKSGMKLVISIFPYISAIFILIALLRNSGLSEKISDVLEKPFAIFGIPKELAELIILRPFSGGGSLALLQEIYNYYGVDSYIGKLASVILGSTETIFYVTAVYFSKTKIKKLNGVIPISLIASFFGVVIASVCVKIMM